MELTWLGHATFRFDIADGKRIYIDPFLNGNPKCPENEKTPERVDVIAITHAHGDHLGDTVDLARTHGCTVVAAVIVYAIPAVVWVLEPLRPRRRLPARRPALLLDLRDRPLGL